MKIKELARIIANKVQDNREVSDLIATDLPDLEIFSEHQETTFEATHYHPVFCLILQGKKETIVGDQHFSFSEGDTIVVSHELPVVSRITEATEELPYLALIFSLDLGLLRNLDGQIEVCDQKPELATSFTVHRAEEPLVDALHRYVNLLNTPKDIEVLKPLISKEIHYRLMVAPNGTMLRNIANRDSHASCIARAIGMIREQYNMSLSIPEIANSVGMSPSSFHGHFKSVTKTTPLQYQKDLRLIEAKRLLRLGGYSVSQTAYEVGYESPNQFSREYVRKFGLAPSQDGKPEVA